MAEYPGASSQPDPPHSSESRNEANIGARVLKFLSLAIICVVIIEGGLCHEEGKRPATGTISGTTDAEGLNADLMVAIGVGIATLAAIMLVSCCTKKNRKIELQEDDSEPKFQLTASLIKQMDPFALDVRQTDKVTMQAVELFAKEVVIILHTCNEKEYWAALEKLQPPTVEDQSNIQDRPIIYPQVGSVIGWFAGYRTAVVRTGQGNKCRDELMKALTRSFPNGRVIIAAGIAYANDQKRKFADVLISDQIENFVQYKKTGSEIINRGPREEVDPNVQRIFEHTAIDWTSMQCFTCADNKRTSVAHIGCIVSAPTLVQDEVLRNQLMKHTPNAIGGEMEGWVLLELKKTLKGQHNKDIEVIVIKGVADYGDLLKRDKWQWTAAKAAMDCIHFCLSKSGGNDFSGISLSAIGNLPVLDDVQVPPVDPLPPTLTLPPDPPECVTRYAQFLKDKYKRWSTLPDDDWPPSLGRQFTRLALIEQKRELPGAELVATMEIDYYLGDIDNIVKRKKAIQLPEIFLPTENSGQELKILMDGAPGVGKSTLSRKFCKDWARGELLQQYHLVLLLPLRQARIRTAKSIEDFIEADDPDLKQQIVQNIQKTSGEHVLLIVDGYDELSDKERTLNSLFLNVIEGNQFPKCSVLVTSRPYASGRLQQLQSINRHVEVLGFTEEQIGHCVMVHKNIPEKSKIELVQTLKERQDIASLCYIPLNCAIVLYVYEKEKWVLPQSLTKLYEIFIRNAEKRQAKIIGSDPGTIVKPDLQMQVSALSELAFDGMVAGKMVFSTDDLKALFPDSRDCDIEGNLLGLMTAFKWFTSTSEEMSYQFLHLTIQEFLAARWAASQFSENELLNSFQHHLSKGQYSMVLLFLAGISQLRFQSVEDLFQSKLDLKDHSTNPFFHFLFRSHLIYESHNFSLFHNLAGSIVGAEITAASYPIAPFDCLVLAHFLSWCDCLLKLLDLSNCDLTSQSLEILHKVNLEHHGTTQIEKVNLSKNPKIISNLSLLSKLPMFKHTKVLKACGLQYPEGVSRSQVEFHSIMNLQHLTTLEISVEVSSSDSGIYLSSYEFERAVKKMMNMNRIVELKLSGFGLACEVAAYFANGLAQNSSLKKLVLSSNQIGSTGAVKIFRSLEHNTSMKELDLSGNSQLAEVDSEAVGCAIERTLNVNRTLKVLCLSGCGITDPTAKHITNCASNASLETLDIGSCTLNVSCAVSFLQRVTTCLNLNIKCEVSVVGIGKVKMARGTIWCVIGDTIPENCVEFFRALNHHCRKPRLNVGGLIDQTVEHFVVGLAESQSVKTLKFTKCNITSAGAVSIFRSLEHNTSLEELDLSENSQLADGDSEAVGCAIEKMLNVNTTLKVLNLCSCRFTNEVAAYFSNGLAENCSVQKVVLGSNQIGSTGAVKIFRSLKHNTSLEELDLSGNSQLAEGDSEVMSCAIERMLKMNRTLKLLNLSGCGITDLIVKRILAGLTKNTSLVTLDIGSPKLSGSYAVSFFQQITTNATLNRVHVGEVNVLGVGRVKIDRETLRCVIGDLSPEDCLQFFRALDSSGLKVTNLDVQELTDQTAENFAVGLAEVQSVQALKLSHRFLGSNQIGSTGAVSIFRSLEHNTSLEELDLSESSQLAKGDSEVMGCAIERMLNVNTTLKVLNLSGCGIANEVAVCFSNGLAEKCSVRKVVLGSNQIGSTGAVKIFRSLEHNTSLEELDLSGNSQLAEGDSEGVGRTIERMLNVNKTLKVLNLSGCGITDLIVKHILIGLTKNTSLVTLDIGSSKLSGSCAVSLFQQITTNATLSITVDEVNVLGVGRVKMDRETLRCVIGDLIPKNCVQFFRALDSSGLKVSNLNIQELTDQTAEDFAVGLAEVQSVRAFKLSHSYRWKKNISSAGAVSIFRSLEHNTSLEELDLSENSQLTEGDSEAVGCAIERMLNVNTTLKVLNLGGCKFTNEVAAYFSNGLAENCSMQKVVLGSNQFGSTGAVKIFRSLEHNTSLEELDLSGNSQLAEGDSEAVSCAIERMLKMNRKLKLLNLSDCGITDLIVKRILSGPTKNTSLVTLDIGSPKLSGSYAVSLFQQMNTNPTLNRVHVGEVNVLGVGRVKMDRETLRCVIGDLIPEDCLRFFRALDSSGLKVSNLNVQELTDQMAEDFAVGLAEVQSVRAFKLSHSYRWNKNISSAGAVSIFRSLEHNTSLGELDLSENSRLAEGDSEVISCAIERMLNVNTTLKLLNLSGCGIANEVAVCFSNGLAENCSVRKVVLGSNQIGSTGAVKIFRSLEHNTSLEELDLSGNSQLAEGNSEGVGCAIERLLNVNRTLKVLNLSGCGITDLIVKRILIGLTKNTSLVTLDIGSPKLSGSYAVSLFQQMKTNPTLNRVHVGEVNVLGVGRVKMDRETLRCVIGDLIPEDCLQFFRALDSSGLKVTNLDVQELMDQTAENFAVGLAEVQSVQAFELSHSFWGNKNISSAGAVSILRSLEHNTSLEKLDLSGNSQLAEGDSEAVGCAIEKMLNVNTTLKILNLSGCNVTDPIVVHILTALTKNTSLVTIDIRSPKISVGCAVSLFQQMTTHPTLTITAGEVNVLGVGRVKINRGTLLCVIDDLIPESCVEFFRALDNSGLMVSKLNVQELTDQTAEHFAVGLAESQSVQVLKLGHSNITSVGALSIFRSLEHNTSMKELDLSQNSQLAEGDSEAVGCAIERMLNVNRSLKLLNLAECGFTSEVATNITKGPAQNHSVKKVILDSSNICSNGAVSIFKSLEHNTSLEKLDLSRNSQLAEGDSEAVGCAIERMLNVNKTLKLLNLSSCGLNTGMASHIFRSLQRNTSLEKLGLSKNSQLAEDDSEAVGCALEKMLNVNRTLKVLNLSGCNVTDPIAVHILAGLTKNTSLVTLDIGSPKLSGSCAVFLFQQMTTHPTLSITVGKVNVLGVGSVKMHRGTILCFIGDLIPKNCVEFFRALDSSGLKVSNLEVENLTDKTTEHFAVGLAETRSVVVLKLSESILWGENITSAGAVSIFRSLEHNTSLEELDLSGNSHLAEGDSEAVGYAIESMLSVNTALKGLNLSGCNVTDSMFKRILIGLTKNTSLVTLDIGSPKLSVGCAVTLFQQMTTHPTLSITVGEVNVLGVGMVKMARETIWFVLGDMIPEKCVEFFRTLNNSGLTVSNFTVQDLTDQTADHFAACLAESQSVQKLKLSHSFWGNKNITSAGAVSIFRSLEHNTSLEELDLSENSQLAAGDSEAVGCAIERMLNETCQLKLLNLYDCRLTNEVAFYFANGLAQNHSVRKVVLHSNNIGSTGAVSIFRSLEHNTSLEELDLSGNSQLAEGDSEAVGYAIERMLNVNCTLKVLNLSGCNVTDPIVVHILTGLTKNTSLVTLDLGSPKLSGSCAVSLFQQMTTHPTLSITEVNVLGVGRVKMDRGSLWYVIGDLIAENCVEFFRALNNSGLKVSKLNVQDLTDQTAGHFAVGLAESQSVQELKLSHSFWGNKNISSAGALSIVRSLEHSTSLEELHLSENWQVEKCDNEAVGCAIERMLFVNRTLKVLNLNGCRLTNEVVSYIANGLAQNHSVRKVILHSNNIRSIGAVSIFRSLEHNTSLEELDLSGNSQLAEGDSEAVGCALKRMLNVNTMLKRLNLSGCNLTDPVVKRILTGVINTSLVTLDIGLPKLSGSCAVSLFRQMNTNPTLSITVGEVNVLGLGRVEMDRETLRCVIGDLIPENCVEFFGALNNSGLKVSNLNVQDLTDQAAEDFTFGLAEVQSVRAFKLSHSYWGNKNISSDGAVSIFRSLEHNTSLDELDLSENSLLAEGDSEVMSCASFEGEKNISTAGAVSIVRSLKHNTSLEELDLSWNSQLAEGDSESVGCELERMLKVNRKLKVLNLHSCRLNFGDFTFSAPTDKISSEGWVHLFVSLPNNTSLKKLDISSNELGRKESVALAEMLSDHKSLTELNLDGCVIPEAGLREIARGLHLNTSLKMLDIGHSDLGMEGSVALAEMLSCNESLTELSLRRCAIPKAGLREIARGLHHNTSLKKLDISVKKVGIVGSVALAEMLSCNESLTELSLRRCAIPQVGLREIARGLHHNTSLKKLDISKIKVGIVGSVALAKMLSYNKSLTELRCDIPETGLREIARGLHHTTSLKKLDISQSDLSFNELELEESVALAEMLSCNKSLTELKFEWRNIPENGLREIARGLLQNTSLQTLTLRITQDKIFLEEEIERLKRSGNFKSQSSSRLEIIKAKW